MQNLEAAFLCIGLKFRRDATSAEVQLLRYASLSPGATGASVVCYTIHSFAADILRRQDALEPLNRATRRAG